MFIATMIHPRFTAPLWLTGADDALQLRIFLPTARVLQEFNL